MMSTPATDAFERFVGLLDYPMFVVTTRAGEQAAGCLVGFASQSSIHPARFLVGLSKRNHTSRVAAQSDHLAVHLLSRRHIELARLFGGETGCRINKFDRCAWHAGPAETPILDDAIAWFVGRTLSRVDLGDHIGYLLDPIGGVAPGKFDGLVALSDVEDVEPGHEA